MVILLFVPSIIGQEPDWYIKLKRLELLVSSKSDFESVFVDLKIKQKFINKDVETVIYEASEGDITVIHSAGNCSTGGDEDYSTAKGNVIKVIYFLRKKPVKFSRFLIDLNEFKTREEHDGTLYYNNRNLGIEFGTQRGEVIHVEFTPASKHENLKCKNSK